MLLSYHSTMAKSDTSASPLHGEKTQSDALGGTVDGTLDDVAAPAAAASAGAPAAAPAGAASAGAAPAGASDSASPDVKWLVMQTANPEPPSPEDPDLDRVIPADVSSAEGESPWELVIQDKGVKYIDEQGSEPQLVRPCILVIHASAGSGHRTAAIAVEQELVRLRDSDEKLSFHGYEVPKNMDIEVLDVFEWGRKSIDGNNVISHFNGSFRPLYDYWWRMFFTGRLLWGGGTCYSRVYFPALTGYIKEKRPLAVVTTHITAANVAVGARMLSRQNFPVICVPTDYETEGQWPHREADLFCVATESMAETLRARRIPERNIAITGIPARDDFRREYDRTSTLEKFDLPTDKKIVLALLGAHLAQPYVHLREALDKSLPYFNRFEESMQFVMLTGNDVEYAARLRQETEELGLSNVTVLGYVDGMAALMCASDLMICKPGGLTVTECLCARIPMLLVGRAYGQEKINMNMLTSMGAAVHVTTPRELVDVLCRMVQHPEVIDAMLTNGEMLRRPDAAEQIARATYELAYRPAEQLQHRISHFVNLYWGLKPAHVR